MEQQIHLLVWQSQNKMKKYILLVTVIVLGLTACEPNKETPYQDIVFKIGQDLNYRYSDIELYDSSTHILYFKDNHPEFDKISQSTFAFLANGAEVYTGSFWPAYLNSMPSGPFISSPSLFQNFALRVENWNNVNPDLRNDPQLIQSLKGHGLLHSGLSVLINPLVINVTQLSFSFTVTNQDMSDLFIIDPDKTGPNLFHYFTNGLIIRNLNYDIVFSSNIEYATPSPWNSWKIEWLSLIKSGESRTFSINYTMASPLSPGEYNALFVFPGLEFQVSKEQLFQTGVRIWLGNVQVNKKITIQ
jgi:hypothetical protein